MSLGRSPASSGARFSTTAYPAWRRNTVCQRDRDDAHLINATMDGHEDDPDFGNRFIADELIHIMGFQVRENRVLSLCALQGISSSILKRRGSGKKPASPCMTTT